MRQLDFMALRGCKDITSKLLCVWHKLLNIHVHYHLQSLDQRIRDCGIRALSPSDALDDTRAYNAMSKAMQLLKSRLVCRCRNSYFLSSKVIMTPHTHKYTIVAILINHPCRNTPITNVAKIHNCCNSQPQFAILIYHNWCNSTHKFHLVLYKLLTFHPIFNDPCFTFQN